MAVDFCPPRTCDFVTMQTKDGFLVFLRPLREWCSMLDANGTFANTDRTVREYMVRTYSEAANDGS